MIMTRLLIYICSCILLMGCKRGTHQVVELRNSSSEAIYFLISQNKTLSSSNDIAKIRPVTPKSISEIQNRDVEYEDKEIAESVKQNLYKHRIERDSIEILLTSESAGIFVEAISVGSIIKDRYNGTLHIFIISENDLQKYSDQEIIDKKLYTYFKSLTAEDIKEDTLTLEYF